MEEKNTYTPSEIETMTSVHSTVASALNRLEEEMTEAKRIWTEKGKEDEWERMWGLGFRRRYEDAIAQLREAYEHYIPEDMRETFPFPN